MISEKEVREKFNNRLHETFVKLSKKIIGFPDPIYGEPIINVLFKQHDNRMVFWHDGNCYRIQDDVIFVTKNHMVHVEIVHKHKLTNRKINIYISENIDCLMLVIDAESIFTEWSDEYIWEILQDKKKYHIISRVEPYSLRVNKKNIYFDDYLENSWYVSFKSEEKNYILLKKNFDSYSDSIKEVINAKKENNTILYSKGYDSFLSLKENLKNIKIKVL